MKYTKEPRSHNGDSEGVNFTNLIKPLLRPKHLIKSAPGIVAFSSCDFYGIIRKTITIFLDVVSRH